MNTTTTGTTPYPAPGTTLYRSAPQGSQDSQVTVTAQGGDAARITITSPHTTVAAGVCVLTVDLDDLGDMLRQLAAASGRYAVVGLTGPAPFCDTPAGRLIDDHDAHVLTGAVLPARLDEADLWALAALFASAATHRTRRNTLTAPAAAAAAVAG